MSKIELDDFILLNIDYSLKEALFFLRSAQGKEVTEFYSGLASIEKVLSDTIDQISEQVSDINKKNNTESDL